jgi:hypothetical protein
MMFFPTSGKMLALKVGHLMSVLRKIRSYRFSFDNQQNGAIAFCESRRSSPRFRVRQTSS